MGWPIRIEVGEEGGWAGGEEGGEDGGGKMGEEEGGGVCGSSFDVG